MRRLERLIAACLICGAAPAQVSPSPDSPTANDKAARPSSTTSAPAGVPVQPDSGMPSDVHTTPPLATTQAPPATSGNTASTEAKAKGRAKPSSTAKSPPRA